MQVEKIQDEEYTRMLHECYFEQILEAAPHKTAAPISQSVVMLTKERHGEHKKGW